MWTHREGALVGGAFLVDMAAVLKVYVAARLRDRLELEGRNVTAQDRRCWLDTDRAIALRPDIVVSRDGALVTVADTKYKIVADGRGVVPNGDAYQAVAYALALGVNRSHLVYVSGDVIERELDIPIAGVPVHALRLAGGLEEVEGAVGELAKSRAPIDEGHSASA